MEKRRFGFHVARDGNLEKSLKAARKLCTSRGVIFNCAQIFLGNPMAYGVTCQNDVALQEFAGHNNIDLYVHGAYVDYIFGDSNANGTSKNTATAKAAANIVSELKCCEKIGARALIIHLGRPQVSAKQIASILDKISSSLEECKSPSGSSRVGTTASLEECGSPIKCALIFELNAAANNRYAKISVIGKLLESLSCRKYNFPIGYCLDTAHLFASGVDIGIYSDAKKYLSALYKMLKALNVPFVIHLNDSIAPFNSGVDRHGPCGSLLFKKTTAGSGLDFLLAFCEAKSIPVLLERAAKDIPQDLDTIYSLGRFRDS